MPRPVSSWDCLGELWGACWGLQGAISLAGEVSALGLVLKHAEVARLPALRFSVAVR